jgi:hypothetical protein
LSVISALASLPVGSATSSGTVPGGLVDSSGDWDTVTSPLDRAPTLTHEVTVTGRKTIAPGIPDLIRLVRSRRGSQPGGGSLGLVLAADRICAITRFGGNSLFRHFGLPRSLRD